MLPREMLHFVLNCLGSFSSSGTSIYLALAVQLCALNANEGHLISKQGANLYNSFLCSFKTMIHISFSLNFLDFIWIATPSAKEGSAFDVSSFDSFLSRWVSLFLPSCWDACQRRGTHTCRWVYNQQILILRTRVELKYLSPELLLQGLNYKSNFSFKALILFQLPFSCWQPLCAATAFVAAFVDLRLWIGQGVTWWLVLW